MSNLDPKIPDRDLPKSVVRARARARRQYELDADLLEAARAHIATQRRALDFLERMLCIMAESSAMEFEADTRASSLWLLSGRSISFSRALVLQVEGGFGVEAFATARAIHEINRLILLFARDDGDEELRRWLAGVQPKPSRVRRVLLQSERRDYPAPLDIDVDELEAELARMLAATGHTHRDSLLESLSTGQRMMLMGPSPDPAMRAFYAGWCDALVTEVARCVGRFQMRSISPEVGAATIDTIQSWFAETDKRHPVPDERTRDRPL